MHLAFSGTETEDTNYVEKYEKLSSTPRTQIMDFGLNYN